MKNIIIRCPGCGEINTMEDFCVINNVMHERCRKCGYLQEMSLVRCFKKKQWTL
jgi:Zn ribbon nucleic-acid-binding protein